MTTTEQAGNDPRKLAESALELAAAASKGPWKEYKDAVHPTLEWGDSVNADHMICAEFSGPQWRLNQCFVVGSRQLVPDLANALLDALDRIDELENPQLAHLRELDKQIAEVALSIGTQED